MSQDGRAKANRSNAKKSTGPRTEAGKAKSSKNARRYSFTRFLKSDAGMNGRTRDLAKTFLGPLESTHERMLMAEAAADAQARLEEAKRARCQLIDMALEDPATYQALADQQNTASAIAVRPSGQSEDRGLNHHRLAQQWIANAVTSYSAVPENEDERIALTYASKSKELARLDRYIRDFEAARRKALRALDQSSI